MASSALALLGLSARRRLAPHLRPGRDPLGPDAPDADRRRRTDPDRHLRSCRRGTRAELGDTRTWRRHVAHGSPAVCLRWPADRPLHLPGRVRLRRSRSSTSCSSRSCSPLPPASPSSARGCGSARGAAARRRRLLHRPPRLARAHRRPGPRRDDAALPALSRRGGVCRAARRSSSRARASLRVRRPRGSVDRNGRVRRRVRVVTHLDADPVAADPDRRRAGCPF